MPQTDHVQAGIRGRPGWDLRLRTVLQCRARQLLCFGALKYFHVLVGPVLSHVHALKLGGKGFGEWEPGLLEVHVVCMSMCWIGGHRQARLIG